MKALALAILGWNTWASRCSLRDLPADVRHARARPCAPLRAAAGARARAALAGLVLVPFLATQALHIWADATYYVPITGFTPYLPLFRPWSARDTLIRLGIVSDETAHAAALAEQLGSRPTGLLNYPLAPMRCAPPARLPNILVIGLDAMRPDAVDPRIAPNIDSFAQRAIRFDDHWSGGNGTRVGLFSLFYAIPATYWQEFYSEQRSPVLIDQLQAAGYQLGIFPGNQPDKIVGLDRTAFRNVPAADLVATRGDAKTASGWIHGRERDPAKPFFGFLFFESAPGGCSESYPQVGELRPDATEMEKRRLLRHRDPLRRRAAGEVLKDLERRGLADDTIVIITSDHGQEFDENGLGSRPRLELQRLSAPTPFILRWPGRLPGGSAAGLRTTTSLRPCSPTCSAAPIRPATTAAAEPVLGAGMGGLVAASYTGFAVQPRQVTISSGSTSRSERRGLSV